MRIRTALAAILAAVAAVVFVITGIVAGPWLTNKDSYNSSLCEQIAWAIDADRTEMATTLPGETRTALEWNITELQQQARDAHCNEEVTPNPESASASSSAGTEPAADTTATASPAPDSSSASGQEATSAAEAPAVVENDSWTPHYFTTDPGKTGPRDFGPAIDPATAVDEFRPHMEADPALLVSNGEVILHGVKDTWEEEFQVEYMNKVNELLGSRAARDAYLNSVFDTIAEVSVETRSPGTAATAYMVVGEDGIPRLFADVVDRSAEYHVLKVVTKDGRVYYFRLECGYQWDEVQEQEAPAAALPYTQLPEPIAGHGRDENGTPIMPPPSEETAPGSTPPGSTPPGSSTPTTSTPTTSTPTTSTPTTSTTTSKAPKTGQNDAAVSTGSESHTVNYNDGATDSQGIQDDPEQDAEEAASSAASSNAAQSSAASSAAEEADTDSGQTEPGGHTDTGTSGDGEPVSTGAAGEDTSGEGWEETGTN